MAFYTSSRDVRLNSDSNLKAKCMNMRREWEDSTFLLTHHLGNDDGSLKWGGRDFQDSARDLSIREGRFLEGNFRAMSGMWKHDSMDLEQYLSNSDGALRAVDDKQDYLLDESWHQVECYVGHEASGLCLDLDNGSSSNGTKVQGWSHMAGNPNQIWYLEKVNVNSVLSAWTLRNRKSGTYLDLSSGGSADGTKVQAWQQSVGEDNQRWFLTTQQEGSDAGLIIQNARTFTVMTGTPENSFDRFRARVTGCHRDADTANQSWRLQRNDE